MIAWPSERLREVSSRWLRGIVRSTQDVDRPRARCPFARDGYANASDEVLLALAYREGRVLITEGKDFGELVFALRRPHPCIVRLDGLTATEEAAAMRNLIDRQGAAMREGAIIVVTGKRMRIRPAKQSRVTATARAGGPTAISQGVDPAFGRICKAVAHTARKYTPIV